MAIFHTINHATLIIFTTFDRTNNFPRVEAKLITTLLLSFNKYKVKRPLMAVQELNSLF